MEKLTIEDLAQYLAHKLNAILSQKGVFNLDSEYPNEYKNKIGFINMWSIFENEINGMLQISDNYSFDFLEIDEITPIMYPLSALIEPILEGGKIPIVELAKMAGFRPTKKIITGIEGEFCFVNIDKKHYGIQDKFSYFTKNMVFRTVLNGYGCFNQLQLFKQLYAWHFWLGNQSYFEKGLLIDKRTV